MSTELLVAILGQDAVDRMSAEQLTGLVRELDAAILDDPTLVSRLTGAVERAMSRSEGNGDPARRGPLLLDSD